MLTDLPPTKQVRYYLFMAYTSRLHFNFIEPGVHHIPLDIHGFPDIPNYNMDEDSKVFEEKNERRKVKKSTKRKPLYKPPPVLTEYSPPKSSSRLSPEYRHQYPDTSSSSEIDQKVKNLYGSF